MEINQNQSKSIEINQSQVIRPSKSIEINQIPSQTAIGLQSRGVQKAIPSHSAIQIN
jgi:hypothetical protein